MLKTLDLRAWLDAVEDIGQVQHVRGAKWDLEIGAISELNVRRRPNQALLFDEIPGYPEGFRVLTGSLTHPKRIGLCYRLENALDDQSLVAALEGKPLAWERAAARFEPHEVAWGPVLENVLGANEYDLLAQFPVPRWHELDGGRYLGTGSAVITSNRDSAVCNIGSYRMMVLDRKRITTNIVQGKHGKLNYESWWSRGEKAPIVACMGHDPLLFALAGTEVPLGVSEFNYAGAVLGNPVDIIRSEITGLPIPACAEIAIEGWLVPDARAHEGPFGEWTGYYSDGNHNEPVVQVERILHRNRPIILGSPPGVPPHDFSYFRSVLKSAMIRDGLRKAGVPDVRAVWSHEAGGGRQFVVVSIHQRYPGHVRQAGFVASQIHAGAYMGKYVVIVDDDIDVSNLEQVIWAMCFRCDPQGDIDFIRRAWGGRADPLCFDHNRAFNSRAIIDACVPWEHQEHVPQVARMSQELENVTRARWGFLWEDRK